MNRVCARAREMLKPFGKKTNTAKRALRVLAVPLAACALMFGATSASADQAVPFSNHTVQTVNPTGTTVNLFDYWVVNGDNDSSKNINNDNKNDNTGINKDHQLKFNGGAGSGINKWTGRSGTGGFGRLSFVKNTLVDGYPSINAGTYTSYGLSDTYADESLAYLFNNDKQNGKAVYNNVKGLFQLKDGYYVYDSYGSDGNYAVYSPATNSFNVYDSAGVYKGSSNSETNLGQFFPFDSAYKVFDEQGNKLSPKKIVDGSTSLNHHFGMSMTTEFVQPNGGKTTKNEDMIFEFSGDDDVWVYIDGVLVGDLGGIHEKATLKINFATGGVHVGHIDNANDPEQTIQDTTIRAMFEAAGADTTNFRENTFQNSTKHTLSFFYLERGAGASNMSLKFNLTTLPSSEVAKVDQNGEAVQGAKFALYQSDESWTVQDGAEAIAQGTTDDKGQLVLLKSDGSVLSFDNQHADGHDYFVLKETGLPEGYRSSLTSSTTATPGELHLQYKQTAASGSGGVVVAPETTVTMADGATQWTGSRMWLNGGYLAAKETISLDKEKKDNKGNAISSGTTFAVVLKLTGASEDHKSENAWTAVTGNPLEGYKLCSKHGIEGAVEAAKSADTSVFAVNTKGDYEVTVRSLPGDIEKYAAMMEDKSQSEYTVAVYHTTASSLAEATTENTSMVEYQSINRQFSTVIHLTNVQNRLFVQKVDDLGEPVNGATFDLYKADAVTGDSPSTYAIKPGATPYDTVQANGMTYPYEIKDAACFPLNSAKHAPLIKGTYYLRESGSPDGYELNTTITKVIVDDSGVYVDAGKVNDGVCSMSGPGSLIASLAQFGSPDSIDNTLTHIKGKLQSATGADAKGNLTWGQTSAAKGVTPTLADGLMHMRYDKTPQGAKTVLRYVEDGEPRDGQLATIYADTGINRMALYQDDDATNGTDLGTLQLNHLFTTATAVQYTDRRVARLQVTKTVTADNGLTAPTKDAKDNDLTFTFKFTLPESQKGYEAHVFEASGKPVGNSFRLKNGDTHSIKAGEIIRVYDLKKDDNYSVSELTTKGEESSGNVLASIVNTVTGSADESVLPAGFSLVSRKAGGEEQSGAGNTIEGKIVALVDGKIPASNKLEFINNYSASSVTLDAQNGLKAKKVLEGRSWADGDTFTAQLTAEDGVPMPYGAKSKVSTVEFTKNAQTATFGDITYTKPGTYTYTISEVIPGSDARAGGISYSAAVYTAEVVVEDNHAGALVVKSVKMVQECNDAGAETKTDVANKNATFTNRYDEHEHDIILHAQKNLVDNSGTFPLSQNAFSFTLEGVGGLADINATFKPNAVDTSVKAPMPQGAEGNTMKVSNNADGTVTWPAISYTAQVDMGRAYVYKFAENPGSVTGMTYDGSVYYAVVRNAEKGAGIQTSVEYYYNDAKDGSVKQLGNNATPSFTNIYIVEPTSVTLQGQKTVSGRDWNQGESYTFNLTAATDDASATSLGKTTKQAVADGAVVINTNQAVASAPESGRVASFSFGTEAAPTVTFNRAGTFSFNITENVALGAPASMSMDRHTARATVVVTDLDERGNHTGKLRVSSVTYANTGASDTDKDITDKAAFTNAYHASGTFGGVTVSKTLEGRASTAGQFTFAVTGLWYNGVQTSVDGAEANLSNKAAKAGVSGAVVGASGAEKLFARKLTEQDLGHTFAYRIHENQPATAAGYAYDTGYTGDAIVLVKVLARKDDPAKLYTVTTVLKGAGVTELLGDGADASALTDEKIVELKQDSHTYVQQYDASETGATTPAVSFVNRYTASLDYGANGGLQIEKTLTYPKDATIFGSPKSTFRYIVKPADETSASKVGISTNGKVFETANVEANAPKTVSLVPAGGLTFTQDDAGKTFTYTVSEIDDKATGYTYDETVHTVRAVVADNGDGTLRVTTSVSKQVDGKDELEGQWIYPSDATSTGVATVKFKNTYTVAEAATYTPSVTKVVAGANAPDKFTFAMTAADDVTKAAIDGKLITGSSMSAENGYAEKKQTKEGLKDGEHYQLDFSKLTFNKPGTYKFAINEVAANSGLGEWKYDQHVYTVTVTVTDEGGKLVARADGTTGSEGFIFTNSYQTSTSYELQGGLEIVKTLNGHDLHAGMFGFTVTGEDDASIEKLNKLLRADEGELTVTNDEPQADGTSHTGILGGLTFATGDADKTFAYKIVENGVGRGGYTYDSTYWKVEIAVKKRDNGSLYTVTTVKHYDANDVEEPRDANTFSSKSGTAKAQVSFTNSYIATGTFDGLAAEKVMDSGDKIEAGQYTFDLYAEKTDGSLEKMDEGKTQASDNGIATVDFGKVDFKLGGALGGSHELTIDLAGAVKDGVATKQHNADHTTTYSFNLVAKERLANLPEGVRPVDTSATCRVLLEVTDNNNGKLTSKVTYRNGTENGKIVFHNTRDKVKTIGTVAKPDVDIDGQLLSVGDSYVYTINWVNTEADANGNLVPANVTVTDKLPAGVVFEAFEGECADKGAASGQSLTWDLGKQPAGSHGSVRVRVKITEDAVEDAQGAVGTVKNAATITVGNKSYTGTTTNYVPKKSESDAQDSSGLGIKLGDELTYTIGYKNTEGASATVKITDAVPAGTEFVEFAGDHKDAGSKDNDGSLTWTLKDVPAGKEGTVQFKVRVTEDAFKSGGASGNISNQASVTVGNNPAVKTNTTTDEVSDGRLTLSKTVTAAEGITAPNKAFTFKVLLYQADGTTPLAGTFAYAGRPSGTNGTYVSGQIKSGDTIALKAGGSVTVTLPVGARYTVTEDAAEGYTTTVNGADGSKAEGAVTEDGATVAFTNTYGTATEGRDVSTAGLFTKALEGRDWAEGDSFQFALTGEGSAPMPEGSVDGSKTVSVTAAAGTKAGDKVAFDFGSIRYTLNDIKDAEFAEVGGKRVRAKTFTYTVREVRPDDGSAIAGVDYDGHVATMTVTVADDGSGNLTATTPAIAQVSGGDFVNTYTTELDYSARAGVRLSKTLSGRAMEAGQFAFTVTADAETAAKLGLKTGRDAYAVAAADDGKADLMDIIGGAAGGDVKFTDADAGKTYSFTVTETKLGGEGYTNDTAPRTVTIAPGYDAATGRLTVTTTVAKDGVEVARSEVSTADDATETPAPVTVAFQNSYEATGTLGGEGNVAINATKTLTGRAAAAGEFSFSVRDAQGNVVATATNQASGDGEAAGLAFSPIAYTTDALERMVADGIATRAADGSWVIPYTVSEDGTDRLSAGVTATASSFDITVKVTDNGKGGLDVAVVYPEGSDGTLSFVNGYGTNEATVDLAGTKTLALGQAGLGLTQADIAGKYTFKITPLDGAPAPVDASGKTVTEATNDAAGNVELGHVTFRQPSDLDDVEIDGGGLRTKTFAYRVSESGSVDGVVNDATATRTFTVKVVEDTNAGTLVAEVLPAEGTPEGKGAFEFTNTYGVNPTPSSVTDQIKVNKKLKGRDLAEGEFEFQLVEIAADGSESVAATGKNAADGTVALSPVTYTAPGTHGYELREIAGTAGGVTYDRAAYRVRTTVADAGNGTLTVRHELADAEGNPTGGDSVTFTNGYEAAPVTLKLGAAKVLKGAELKAGQFSFELKGRDGKVMSTAKNAADGSVTFDALTFKQAGTYTFTVSEVDDGQAHVTYDKAVHKIVVTVSDEAADGSKTGYLSAKVSYEGDANLPPVFTNSYAEEPGTPGTPENPGTPGGGSGGGSDSGSGDSSGGGSKGGMPDTGDRSLPATALGAMAGIGALAVAGGAVLYRRRR